MYACEQIIYRYGPQEEHVTQPSCNSKHGSKNMQVSKGDYFTATITNGSLYIVIGRANMNKIHGAAVGVLFCCMENSSEVAADVRFDCD